MLTGWWSTHILMIIVIIWRYCRGQFQFNATIGLPRNNIITTKCDIPSMGKQLKDSLFNNFLLKRKNVWLTFILDRIYPILISITTNLKLYSVFLATNGFSTFQTVWGAYYTEDFTVRHQCLTYGFFSFSFLPESVLCIEDSIIALSADIASNFSL